MNTLSHADTLPSSLARPASRQTPSSYFYPHGLWAPGVRMMRNMQFTSKAVLISLLFCLPLAWAIWGLFTDRLAAIDFSSKELDGVTYNRTLIPLIDAAQQLRRDRTAQAISGAPATTLPAVLERVQAAQKEVAAMEQKLGKSLGTATAYQNVQSALAEFDRVSGAEAVFAAHTAHVDALLGLLAQVTDNSNLTLDPDIDTFYLMDSVYGRMSSILEFTAKIRGRGRAAMLSGQIQGQTLRDLSGFASMTEYQYANLLVGLGKVIATDPELKSKLDTNAAEHATAQFNQHVREALLSDKPDTSELAQAKLLELGNAAITEQLNLSVRIQNVLEELLDRRVNKLKSGLYWTCAVVTMGVILAAYFFYCFYLVTRGGLRLISHHLKDMSAGDFRTAPSQPWGKDEPAEVIIDLQATYDALHQLIVRVHRSAAAVSSAANEIASASADLSSRTEAAAAALEEQAAAMEQIGSTVGANAERAQGASRFSGDNAVAAQHAGSSIDNVVGTMAAIHTSSEKISDIISVIDGIAFQTNILALNAAVEAARAGESGRGFAVVASEVRSLAKRSANAAHEIKDLITSTVGTVNAGREVVERAGRSMTQLVVNAHEINAHLNEIAVAANEQAVGVEQVGQVIQNLDRDTQQNAALVEQTHAASEALRGQADLMMSEIDRFRLA